MLGSRRVQRALLHIPSGRPAEHPLVPGVHRVLRGADGHTAIDHGQPGMLLVQFCLDQRGLWLQVPSGMRSVHVNGRPVRRMALLRAGDNVYADGVDMRVSSPPVEAPSRLAPGVTADPRVLLRGIGGPGHGRAVPVLNGLAAGSDPDADIVLEGAQAPDHARLAWTPQGLLLRHADPQASSRVNGVAVGQALLGHGDMLEFDPQSRWCVELPVPASGVRAHSGAAEAQEDRDGQGPVSRGRRSWGHWPWLLASALLLSALLSALLLFGAG